MTPTQVYNLRNHYFFEILLASVNMLLSLTLLQIVFVGGEESLFWYSKDVNLIAPNYLPEARKENRRLAVVIDGRKVMTAP